MKAADIPDRKMLEAVKHEAVGHVGARFTYVCARFPEFPVKVVRAKLHALLRRDLIDGCVCGCRGDFELTDKGRAYFEGLHD